MCLYKMIALELSSLPSSLHDGWQSGLPYV
jgi:hypothetical protein